MFYQLVYLSSTKRPATPDVVRDILLTSRRNNARDGITGFLFYHDHLFFQVFEGEHSVVERCYSRVKSDPRHVQPSIMWTNTAEARSFPEWEMGYATPEDLGDTGGETVLKLAEIARSPAASVGSDRMIETFIQATLKNFKDLRS